MQLQTMPLRFRVWDKEKREFVSWDENYCFDRDETNNLYLCNIDWYSKDLPEEDSNRFIISQDTGLKDKNGKSIYIGDILKVEYVTGGLGEDLGYCETECESIGMVTYDYLYGICLVANEETKWWLDEITDSTEDDATILGNIWENEDLLKEED